MVHFGLSRKGSKRGPSPDPSPRLNTRQEELLACTFSADLVGMTAQKQHFFVSGVRPVEQTVSFLLSLENLVIDFDCNPKPTDFIVY